MTWTVVEFLDSMTVEAIPTSWLLKNQCYWPPMPRERIVAEIKKNSLPNTCWPLYTIRTFKDGTYDDYIIARNKAKKAEDTSDLNSETDGRRKIISRKISTSESDESEFSRLPNPPKMNMKKKSTRNDHHEAATLAQVSLRTSFSETQDAETTRVDSGSTSMFRSECAKEIPSDDFTSYKETCKCCKIHQKKIESFMFEILKKFALLRANILQLSEDIQNIINERNFPVDDNSFLNSFQFPVDTVESLEVDIEHYLKDEAKFRRAIQDLSKFGGSSTYDFIKRCFLQTISNDLAEKYSYYGAKQKRPFKDLKFNQILLRAAEIHSGADQKITEEAVKKWLRRAKERRINRE